MVAPVSLVFMLILYTILSYCQGFHQRNLKFFFYTPLAILKSLLYNTGMKTTTNPQELLKRMVGDLREQMGEPREIPTRKTKTGKVQSECVWYDRDGRHTAWV